MLQEQLESQLSTSISFDSNLDINKKIVCLENLKSGLMTKYDGSGISQMLKEMLNHSNLNISSCYGVNDDGSIDIPWNFKWTAK